VITWRREDRDVLEIRLRRFTEARRLDGTAEGATNLLTTIVASDSPSRPRRTISSGRPAWNHLLEERQESLTAPIFWFRDEDVRLVEHASIRSRR